MFYGQCNACGERWGLGTASTCKCPQPDTWVGLTDQQVFDLADKHLYGGKNYNILSFYKAIEEKLRSKNDQA